MPVAFNDMPNNILTPLAFFEVRGAQTPFSGALRLMLLGHKNTVGGSAAYDKPYRLSNSNAKQLFGPGSMVHAMYQKAKMNGEFVEIWGITTTPQVGSTPAVRQIVVDTVPPFDGVATIYIAGYPVSIVVRKVDTLAQVATRLRAAVNNAGNQTRVPVKALTVGSDVAIVELQAKWAGESGNDIPIELSIWGDENKLANAIYTLGTFTPATGNVSLAAGLASMGDEPYDVIAVGFEGVDAQLAQLKDFMDHTQGRWSPLRQIFGHTICARVDAYSDLVTDGLTQNNPHNTTIGLLGSPSPPWEWSAAFGAVMAAHWDSPPSVSRPLQTLELNGVQPPRNPLQWFTADERNGLLTAGISTYTVDKDRTVRIERVRTNYQTNPGGDPDDSLADAITLFQAMFFTRSMKTMLTGNFGRHGLKDDASDIAGITSPSQLAEAMIHEYIFLETQGLVEHSRTFAQSLVVERNAFDADRVDAFMPIDVVNQLRVIATVVEINLQASNN